MRKGNLQIFTLTSVLFVLIISGVGTAFAQAEGQAAPAIKTGEQAAPPATTGAMLNTANKLRLQFEGALGIGLDSSKVGVTTGGDDVKISGGGGAGFGVSLGYGLSRSFDIDCTLGVQVSGLQPAVKNADGSFTRSFFLATAKYKVPIRENLQWKFGLGAGYYMGGKLDIDVDPGIPGAGHSVVDYKNAAGVHATGELEIALRSNLMLAVGLKYYMVTYKADKATFNGASDPVSSLPDEFRNFNGDGVDITVGLGILF